MPSAIAALRPIYSILILNEYREVEHIPSSRFIRDYSFGLVKEPAAADDEKPKDIWHQNSVAATLAGSAAAIGKVK